MPSLVFHEGKLEDGTTTVIPTSPRLGGVGLKAGGGFDNVGQPTPTPPKRGLREMTIPQINNPDAYNPTARRLMWLAVIFLSLVICGLWAWSITTQFYNIKWSAAPEKILIDNLQTSWSESFQTEGQPPLTNEQLKNNIKENLSKLFAGVAIPRSGGVGVGSTTLTNPPLPTPKMESNPPLPRPSGESK